MSEQSLEQMLEAELASGHLSIGEVAISPLARSGYELRHRSGGGSRGVPPVRPAAVPPAEEFAVERAMELAKFDDTGNYRQLRTAPNLRRAWKIKASDISQVIEVIDTLYPGRLSVWRAWKTGRFATTSLRATLSRQSGMYRVAARISDDQLDDLVGNFCQSDSECLRTILWRRDETGARPSSELPPEKFDPAIDQTGGGERCMPLLCQEACNLLVAACRDAVKAKKTPGAENDVSG